MSFFVRARDDLSLTDLKAIHDRGGSVVKTPHVGNIYPGNLGVAKAGIRMIFYDRNIGSKDSNFHPHGVIRGSRFEALSDRKLLTTHAKASKTSSLAEEWFRSGDSMLERHMASLRKSVPELQGEVYSDYLRVRSRSATDVLRATADSHPTLWERSVQANGTVVNYSCRGWADLARSGVLGVTRQDSGALIPNALNVVLISVLEAHERGVSEVYHLSGPDMVRYIGLLQGKFDELYTAVRSALPTWKLPETLTF
ncbi:hypothetical protein HY771_00255, partial [Candidatus Uhrbacteria bacterium]|nr:hypothetical protein [Candidatus Uhrbacteria bacterium]